MGPWWRALREDRQIAIVGGSLTAAVVILLVIIGLIGAH